MTETARETLGATDPAANLEFGGTIPSSGHPTTATIHCPYESAATHPADATQKQPPALTAAEPMLEPPAERDQARQDRPQPLQRAPQPSAAAGAELGSPTDRKDRGRTRSRRRTMAWKWQRIQIVSARKLVTTGPSQMRIDGHTCPHRPADRSLLLLLRLPTDLTVLPELAPARMPRSAAYDSAVSSLLAVRPARVEDVVQMARVNVLCWQETYRGLISDAELDDPGLLAVRERFWTAALTDERHRENRVAVAERDGELIGIATWVASSSTPSLAWALRVRGGREESARPHL